MILTVLIWPAMAYIVAQTLVAFGTIQQNYSNKGYFDCTGELSCSRTTFLNITNTMTLSCDGEMSFQKIQAWSIDGLYNFWYTCILFDWLKVWTIVRLHNFNEYVFFLSDWTIERLNDHRIKIYKGIFWRIEWLHKI